ncbi:MAG: hypothetical protein AAFQ81_10765 [Pseudomonadota bacterium]
MSLIRDILVELGGMFWADRRLNLGLLGATALAALLAVTFPISREGIMPVLLTLAYGGVIAWALFPTDRGD